jgi:GNAT superfamily N-acetyltransferase
MKTYQTIPVLAAPKGTDAYTWMTYAGSKPVTLQAKAGRTVELVQGSKWGYRLSSDRKHMRVITEETGPTIVFTYTVDEVDKLIKKSGGYYWTPKAKKPTPMSAPAKKATTTQTDKIDFKKIRRDKYDNITYNGKVIGYLDITASKSNLKQVLEHYEDAAKLQSTIKKLVQSNIFTYVWLEDISIDAKYRRFGIASYLLKQYFKANTLVACNIGSGNRGGGAMNSEARLTFYKKLGFKIVVVKDGTYGFRWGA